MNRMTDFIALELIEGTVLSRVQMCMYGHGCTVYVSVCVCVRACM